jgi:hypothetical protein
MAPGVGGFNIDPPPPRIRHIEGGGASEGTRRQLLLKPEFVPELPIQAEGRTSIAWVGRLSFIFALLAIVAIIGLMLLAFPEEVRKLVGDIPSATTPSHGGPSAEMSVPHPGRLVVASQMGFANEPVPLGILLEGASGGETVTVAGLANGTELSIGTTLGLAGWLVAADDLDKTFVGPPSGFVGAMDATVSLHSASGQLLQSQAHRLEWIEKKEKKGALTPVMAPPEPVAAPQPTLEVSSFDREQSASLITRGQERLMNGDIASARLLLKRAANAGDAQAALALGMTFDPDFLAQRGVLGIVADVAQARAWYDTAIKRGSTEASRNLERLASTPK